MVVFAVAVVLGLHGFWFCGLGDFGLFEFRDSVGGFPT